MTENDQPRRPRRSLDEMRLEALSRRLNPEPDDDDGFDPASVPVGTIPDELRPHWTAGDTDELRALFAWQDRRRRSGQPTTPEDDNKYLHTVRVTRAHRLRKKADRARELLTAMEVAQRCDSCGQPTLRVTLADKELRQYNRDPGQHVEVSPGRSVACCPPCRVAVTAAVAAARAAEQVGDTTRGVLAAELVGRTLGRPQLAPSAAATPPHGADQAASNDHAGTRGLRRLLA